MEQQHQIFCKHDLSTFSEEDECKHKLRLLIEITSGLDQDYLKKTTCVLERDNDLVKNKKSLEWIINEFLTKHLVVDNIYNNLLHTITHLKRNPQSTIEMLSNLASFNREVLHNCKTSKHSNRDKSYEESDWFFLLLNICNEDVLQKFILKHKDVDAEDYLVKQTAQTCHWFKQEIKWS